jgi:hypothetical protein
MRSSRDFLVNGRELNPSAIRGSGLDVTKKARNAFLFQAPLNPKGAFATQILVPRCDWS